MAGFSAPPPILRTDRNTETDEKSLLSRDESVTCGAEKRVLCAKGSDGMINDEIREELLRLQDTGYRGFLAGLIPTVPAQTVIGVRTPELRKLAKQICSREDIRDFLDALPHIWFEENQLHAFIVSQIRDFSLCVDAVDRFLPYIDNWATCDQMSPRAFAKHRTELKPWIAGWIRSGQTYTVRYGIKMLMDHFLDDAYGPDYPEMVISACSDDYYIRTAAAWYFATALAKQYDAVIGCLEGRRLDRTTHDLAIRKACESYRISPEKKAYLKTLRSVSRPSPADRAP